MSLYPARKPQRPASRAGWHDSGAVGTPLSWRSTPRGGLCGRLVGSGSCHLLSCLLLETHGCPGVGVQWLLSPLADGETEAQSGGAAHSKSLSQPQIQKLSPVPEEKAGMVVGAQHCRLAWVAVGTGEGQRQSGRGAAHPSEPGGVFAPLPVCLPGHRRLLCRARPQGALRSAQPPASPLQASLNPGGSVPGQPQACLFPWGVAASRPMRSTGCWDVPGLLQALRGTGGAGVGVPG